MGGTRGPFAWEFVCFLEVAKLEGHGRRRKPSNEGGEGRDLVIGRRPYGGRKVLEGMFPWVSLRIFAPKIAPQAPKTSFGVIQLVFAVIL